MLLSRRTEATSNIEMAEDLELSGALQSPECIAAFRAIDRGHFWVADSGELAYTDMPLRHGKLHQSAPHIYARALEALMPLRPGMSFLNIGSGTGYFSSLVSELIGESAVNDGIDIWPESVAHAMERCSQIGKTGIEFVVGNVYQLDVDQGMRYDRIYIGACANSRSKYLYSLLEVGGVLVGPFHSGHSQQLRRVVRETESHFVVEVLSSVQFATLIEPTPFPSSASTGSSGLPGVPFTFALRERPWSPERSTSFPVSFQAVASAVMAGQPRRPLELWLPPEIWVNHVLPWCPRRWFDPVRRVPTPQPSPVSAALAFMGEATKRALLSRSYSLCSTTDGGSMHGTLSAASNTTSRSRSVDSLGDMADVVGQDEAPGRVLFEDFGNGRRHLIGSESDPDNPEMSDRPHLLAALLEGNTETQRRGRRAAPPAAGGAQDAGRTRGTVRSTIRAVCRCAGRCFALRSTRRDRRRGGAGEERVQERGLFSRGVAALAAWMPRGNQDATI